jgi:hypothetical protein
VRHGASSISRCVADSLFGRRVGYPRPVRFGCLGVAVSALSMATVLSGCSTTEALPVPTTHGPPGPRFSVSFSQPPTVRTFQPEDSEGQALYGTTIATRWIWSGGKVTVWVDALTEPVRPGRLPYLLRSYLPSGPSGRTITRAGDPAMIGVIPGCDPSGQCVGFVGGLVILDGQVIYDVFTSQNTSSAAYAVLDSFRVVH